MKIHQLNRRSKARTHWAEEVPHSEGQTTVMWSPVSGIKKVVCVLQPGRWGANVLNGCCGTASVLKICSCELIILFFDWDRKSCLQKYPGACDKACKQSPFSLVVQYAPGIRRERVFFPPVILVDSMSWEASQSQFVELHRCNKLPCQC